MCAELVGAVTRLSVPMGLVGDLAEGGFCFLIAEGCCLVPSRSAGARGCEPTRPRRRRAELSVLASAAAWVQVAGGAPPQPGAGTKTAALGEITEFMECGAMAP